jgi:hypothetical protein
MGCGCKNKQQAQQPIQPVQTQNQQTTQTEQTKANVQENVKKVISKYYRR